MFNRALSIVVVVCLWFNTLQGQYAPAILKQYHMPGIDLPTGIVELKDGWIISSITSSNAPRYYKPLSSYIIKIDLKGNKVWSRYYGDTFGINEIYFKSIDLAYGEKTAIKMSTDSNILAFGTVNYIFYAVPYLVKINPKNGDTLWSFRENFNDNFFANDFTEDEDGNIYFLTTRNYDNKTGYPYLIKLNKDGKLIWRKQYTQFDGDIALNIIAFKKSLLLTIILTDNIKLKDSTVAIKINQSNGNIYKSTTLINNTDDGINTYSQAFKHNDYFNLFFAQSDLPSFKRKVIQLYIDTNFNIIKKKYINENDSIINPFYGEGYVFQCKGSTLGCYTNKNGKIVLKTDYPRGDDTMFFMFNQSIHGGAYILGYVYTKTNPGSPTFCDFENCTDILFIKTDSMGSYFNTPKQPMPNNVLLYPNPANNSLSFKMEFAIDDEAFVEVFDCLGQLVLATKPIYFSYGYQELKVDISSLAGGIYTVKFHSKSIQNIQKVLIQKD